MAKQNENGNIEKKERFKDQQTDKRIHEHLQNESDSISEDDIKNVKTDESITIANDTDEPLPPELDSIAKESEEEKKEEEDKVIKNNSNPGIETSWNILDS